MAALQQLFESLGFENVRALLNSGNVVFEGRAKSEKDITSQIEHAFQQKFGFESMTMVRNMKDIEEILEAEPFRNVQVGKKARLYITFLREKTKSTLKLPYRSPKGDFRILTGIDRALFSVTLETFHTLDAMAFLEEHFGKDITTRNWNTVLKIAEVKMQG